MLPQKVVARVAHKVLLCFHGENLERLFCLCPGSQFLLKQQPSFGFSLGRCYLAFGSGLLPPLRGTHGCLDGQGHRS
jgi:hypothetical protein